jgi:hypothetical protein
MSEKLRAFWIGPQSWECSPEEFRLRTGEDLDDMDTRWRDRSIEVAPGVLVALLGTGDTIAPDGQVKWGARILVWEKE